MTVTADSTRLREGPESPRQVEASQRPDTAHERASELEAGLYTEVRSRAAHEPLGTIVNDTRLLHDYYREFATLKLPALKTPEATQQLVETIVANGILGGVVDGLQGQSEQRLRLGRDNPEEFDHTDHAVLANLVPSEEHFRGNVGELLRVYLSDHGISEEDISPAAYRTTLAALAGGKAGRSHGEILSSVLEAQLPPVLSAEQSKALEALSEAAVVGPSLMPEKPVRVGTSKAALTGVVISGSLQTHQPARLTGRIVVGTGVALAGTVMAASGANATEQSKTHLADDSHALRLDQTPVSIFDPTQKVMVSRIQRPITTPAGTESSSETTTSIFDTDATPHQPTQHQSTSPKNPLDHGDDITEHKPGGSQPAPIDIFSDDPVAIASKAPTHESGMSIFDETKRVLPHEPQTPSSTQTPEHRSGNTTPEVFHARDAAGIQAVLEKVFHGVSGKLSGDELVKVGPEFGNNELYPDAAVSMKALSDAFKKQFGYPIGMTDGYRSYEDQVTCRADKGSLCADPGTSIHGWGMAADIGEHNVNDYNSPQHKWLVLHAPDFGWHQPDWAKVDGSKPEPWHWEYIGDVDIKTTGASQPGAGSREHQQPQHPQTPEHNLPTSEQAISKLALERMASIGPEWKNRALLMQFMMDNGFKDYMAAALVGNACVESGGKEMNPAIHQFGGGPGRAWMQWGSTNPAYDRFGYDGQRGLVKYASDHGGNWYDPDMQEGFIIYELNTTESNAKQQVLASKNLAEATAAWMNYYLRPAERYLTPRLTDAKETFAKYQQLVYQIKHEQSATHNPPVQHPHPPTAPVHPPQTPPHVPDQGNNGDNGGSIFDDSLPVLPGQHHDTPPEQAPPVQPPEQTPAYEQDASKPLEWPVHDMTPDKLGTPFGGYQTRDGFHTGEDIKVSYVPVYAPKAGKVIYAQEINDTGIMAVIIDHGSDENPDQRYTTYEHLSKFDVSVGDIVSQGEQIAVSGNTGYPVYSSGPHLHFGVGSEPFIVGSHDPNVAQEMIDPLTVLPAVN